MDVGNFYRCRLQIPRNFGSVTLGNLPTRVLVCLLNNAKSPVRMTDLKLKRIFGALVIFTVTDFKFWRICLVNISVGMVACSLQKQMRKKISGSLFACGRVKCHRALQGAPLRGRQLYFTFPGALDPLFKASKAPFLTLRVATLSGAPRQAPLENGYHLSYGVFFPCFIVCFASKLATFPLKGSVLGA